MDGRKKCEVWDVLAAMWPGDSFTKASVACWLGMVCG